MTRFRISALMLGFIILAPSCDLFREGAETQIPPLIQKPGKARVDTREGYQVHPLTGDTILPIRNSRGDTILTGKILPVSGRRTDTSPSHTPSPVKATPPEANMPAPEPHTLPARPSVHSIQAGEIIRPFGREGPDPDFRLVNLTGDTIPTGKPLDLTGKEITFRQKLPDPALPAVMKDQATEDLTCLDTYHGLFASQVISLLEDRRSRIWIGTTGGGASVYNGSDFVHLTEEEGLCESWILCMLEDRKGNLWFGSNGEGLIRFDGDVFTHFTLQEGLNDNLINALEEDSRGNIWIGTQSGGLSRFDGSSFTHLTTREGLPANRILALHSDSDDRLWIGMDQGICLYEDDSVIPYGGLGITGIRSIQEDLSGQLWIGTAWEGIYCFSGDSLHQFTTAEGMYSNSVNSVLQGPGGNLWITTTLGGVTRFDGHSLRHYTTDQGLAGNWVVPAVTDSKENVWFGAIGGGISIYRDGSFRHYTEIQGLSSRAVYSILEDSEGNIWFGTLGGGVCKLEGDRFYRYPADQVLSEGTVESALQDSRGDLWFGTAGSGVIRFDGDYYTIFGSEEGFTHSAVGSMVEDNEGNIWFGTFGSGVIRYDGSGFTHFTTQEGMISDLVESVFQDSNGNIWIGTLGGGVTRFGRDSLIHYTRREGLASDHISCIFEDSRGILWFGTMTAGVTLYDGETFTYLTEEAGLNDHMIRSVTEDEYGRIWISTDQGLNLLRKSEGEDMWQVHSFGLHDGLKGVSFLQNSVLADSRGRIWWGSNKSLAMLQLDEFKLASGPPDLLLDRVDINGRFMDYRMKGQKYPKSVRFDSVAAFHNYPDQFRVPSKWNHLTFHFSATDWVAPHKILYTYRMEEPRSAWSVPSPEPFADYRNLPFGKHTFMVRAIGESQKWSRPVTFSFIILPPWYHTWWARAAYVLSAILLIFSYTRWRTGSLKRRQAVLETTVEDRTREISEQREELLQQNENLALQQKMIERQNLALTDSIRYAKRIQTATFPPEEVIRYLIPKHFILYRPLQIVSGDFYWIAQKEGRIVLAVADCTGHGVPGAFMSMLGSALLNDIVNQSNPLKASAILDELRDQVILSLRQTGAVDEARDGMDIGLCIIDQERMALQYAGAHHPLYLIRNGKVQIFKGDPMPIGISSEAGRLFTSHHAEIRKSDTIYMFTDGYVDQLGGERRKRYNTTRFRQLLLDIQDRIMLEQKTILENELDSWMGKTSRSEKVHGQIDDILVLGIKI